MFDSLNIVSLHGVGCRTGLTSNSVMAKKVIDKWLATPNGAFDGLTPLEVIERGDVNRIWRMVGLLESGRP